MNHDEVQQALIEHKIDFALMFSPPPLHGVKQQLVCKSQLVMMYPCELLPDTPSKVSLEQFEHLEVIGIDDSGPLGDLLWHRLVESALGFKTNITVKTYFIAARLVAQNIGVCIIDEFSARGNLCDKVGIATIEPALNFNLTALQLEDKNISKIADDFLQLIIQLSNANQPTSKQPTP